MKKLLFSFLILLIGANLYAMKAGSRDNFYTFYQGLFFNKIEKLDPEDEIEFVYPLPENSNDKVISSIDFFVFIISESDVALKSMGLPYIRTFVAGTFKGSKHENAELFKAFALELIKKYFGEQKFDENFKNEKLVPLLNIIKSLVDLGLIELNYDPFIDNWEGLRADILTQLSADVSAVNDLNAQGKLSQYQNEKLLLLLQRLTDESRSRAPSPLPAHPLDGAGK